MRKIIVLSVLTYILSVNPQKEVIKSKNPLPYFRRKVEEIGDDIPIETVTEDTRGKLLSLLVHNVKEIFNDITDQADAIEYSTAAVSTSETLTPTRLKFDTDDLVNIESTTTTLKYRADDLVTIEHTNDVTLHENLSVTTLDRELDDLFTTTKFTTKKTTATRTTILKKSKKIRRVKDKKSLKKTDATTEEVTDTTIEEVTNAMSEEVTPAVTSVNSYVLEPTMDMVAIDETNKTCIYCDNIITENCYDPKNKIVPSVTCKRESDLCYSMHTPFGIVDRGCFNINYDITTYVCSCNLCNYISISEMPYIFAKRQDWVNNVIELSQTRSFRKSVFKDMSCLRCEVHTTNKTGDIVDTANCLEGNIATLPLQDCDDDEICGVKAVRSDGYIWRGCLKAPLYNYWWALCDHDLCNHDSLVSVYDITNL